MKPHTKRKGIATATEGKVCQKLLVTRWIVNFGISGAFSGLWKNRYAVGQTNMYSAAISGTYTNRRDRNAFGWRPILFKNQPKGCWRAAMGKPQLQAKQPKVGVA